MSRVLALVLVLAVTGCVCTRDYAPADVRYFAQVPGHASVFDILGGAGSGDTTRMIEIDDRGRPVSDTLDVWVQHCPRTRCHVPERALRADLLITCYPNNLDARFRAMHVFPYYPRTVYLYRGGGGPVVVSAGAVPEIEVLLGVPGISGARRHAHE